MSSHRDWASGKPEVIYWPSPAPATSTGTKLITTVAFLVLGYYASTLFNLWPSTIKRSAFELFVLLVPSIMISIMESGFVRLGRLPQNSPRFRAENFGDHQAKIEALRRVVGLQNTGIGTALRRVRTFSGFENIMRSTAPTGPAGLGNWDNSCYQNSVLQGIASLPSFVNFIQKASGTIRQSGGEAPTHTALEELTERLNDVESSRGTLWTPSALKSMDSWQQQDAQEYFSRVLDELDKEFMKDCRRRRKKPGLETLLRQQREACNGELDCQTVQPPLKHSTSNDGISQKDLQPGDDEIVMRDFVKDAPEESHSISPLRNPLDGMLAQGLECQKCGYTEGLSLIQFNCLTVNLGLSGHCSVETLLDEYTALESIEGVECPQCTRLMYEKSEAKRQASENASDGDEEAESTQSAAITAPQKKSVFSTKTKQIAIGRAPKDLVIHINRSIFDEYGNQRKNSSHVSFPSQLELLKKWCAALDVEDDVPEATYELRCVVTHYGRHENGHYVAYAKRGKKWYCFNDEIVSPFTEEEVLDRGNAFMLFYEAMEEAKYLEYCRKEPSQNLQGVEAEIIDAISEVPPSTKVLEEAREVQV